MLDVTQLIGFGSSEAATAVSLSIASTATYAESVGNVSNHAVTLPSGIVSGNLLLVFFACNTGATLTDPSGWTVLVSKTNTDLFRVYAKIASGSEGSSVTVALSSNQRAGATAYRITGNRNGVSTSEIAVSTAVDETTTTPNPPSLTPSWGAAENIWITASFVMDTNYTGTPTYPTNYSLGQLEGKGGTAGNGSGVCTAARLLNAATEDPGTFTFNASKARSSYTLAIRPQ